MTSPVHREQKLLLIKQSSVVICVGSWCSGRRDNLLGLWQATQSSQKMCSFVQLKEFKNIVSDDVILFESSSFVFVKGKAEQHHDMDMAHLEPYSHADTTVTKSSCIHC